MSRILIVEDELDILESIKLRFKSWGFEVITAVDGLEGLEKARSEAPDLVILDVGLPKMDGFQVCRLLKFDERYKRISIVMLTAKTQDVDRRAGQETGADAYVTKPFDAEDLHALVGGLLSAGPRST